MIAKRTQKQSQLISEYAKTARTTEDLSIKEESRKRILLLGAYIKRYANLMLLSQEDGYIETGEFALSVSEVLRYLNYCGIPSEFISNAQGIISADTALKTFEIFETLLESNLSVLKGTFVNLSTEELKITLENLNDTISNSTINELKSYGVQTRINSEDGVTYICFTLGKGGEA